eukprot:4767798-Pyramimonas_sp.AAC.1
MESALAGISQSPLVNPGLGSHVGADGPCLPCAGPGPGAASRPAGRFAAGPRPTRVLSLIHISEPTRPEPI